MRLQGYVKNAK